MTTSTKTSQDFFELVNKYPSPHNGQPIRLRRLGNDSFDIFFDKVRGLQSTEISYIFSFVSVGVFIKHMQLCSQALGHSFAYQLDLPEQLKLHGEGVVKVASCRIAWNAKPPDEGLHQALQFRQTSRKKYFEGVSQQLAARMADTVSKAGMKLNLLPKDRAKKAVWLNQRAVFDDMFDEPVRRELDHWLRYDQAEKLSKRDGLAYDCMELNGKLMKYIVAHPKVLRLPVVDSLLRQYYMRTMSDASDVFYMLAPFTTEEDAFKVGLAIMDIWNTVAGQRYYLHPFGTIMSNEQAHRDFLELAGVAQESPKDSYLVFIFRCGRSEPPIPSLRIPYSEHLMLE